MTGLVAGTANRGQVVKLIQLDDSANYALSLKNAYATSPKLLRAYSTISSVDTDWLTVTGGTANQATTAGRVSARNFLQNGPAIFDVEHPAYGAVGDGSTDDTEAIQSCIDYVKTLTGLVANSNYSGVTIRFNSLSYAVSSLDCTFMHNVHFMGASGDAGTRFKAIWQNSTDHSATGKAVFDAPATASCKWSNILVDSSGASVVPMAGWLFAGTGVQWLDPPTNTIPGSSGANCTKNQLVNCGSFGKFQVAAFACPYSSDHVLIGCGFQQWKKDCPAILTGNVVPSAIASSLTSVVGNSGSADPYTFPPTFSASGGGDLNFIGCEGHHMPASGGESAPYNTGNGFAMIVAESTNVRYIGGNLGSYGTGIVLLGDGAGFTGPITFTGTQFYSDSDTYYPSNGVVLSGSATVNGLLLDGVNWASVPAASGSLIRLNDQSVLTDSEMRKPTVNYAAGTVYAFSTASYATGAIDCIKNSEIDCVGFDVDISTGTGPRLGGGAIFKNVRTGAIVRDTSGADSSVIWGDGFLTLNSGQSTPAATTGALRLQQNSGIYARNNAANNNILLIGSDASDNILIGASTVVATYYLNSASGGTLAVAGGAKISVDSTGIGFNNATPVAKGTITGSRGGNAALASLLSYLASRGDITDSTSA